MAGTKEIKRRIKSVKNTKKITKAMELVAASKMKRAVSRTLASRLYANYSWDLLTTLSSQLEDIDHPFFSLNTQTADSKGTNLIVLISSNRGLCGAYNSQVIKKTISKIKEISLELSDIEFITIGKKGDAAMRRIGQEIILSFTEMPDIITLRDIAPLSEFLKKKFKSGNYANVYVAYTDYISALSQKPQIRKLLPINKEELRESIESIGDELSSKTVTNNVSGNYLLEGDVDTLIEALAEKLVRMQIYQMILESSASEQSSRMLAMKNASDAAGDMIDDLTLAFNKARQASITQEISEISAGMASIN